MSDTVLKDAAEHLPTWEVVLSGDIDLSVAPYLDELVRRCERLGCRDAVVDLSAVTFFGSTGLNFLVRLQLALGGPGGAVTIMCPNPFIARTLYLQDFEQYFSVLRSRPDAEADDLARAGYLRLAQLAPWPYPL